LIDFEGETGSAVGLLQYDCDLDELTSNSYWVDGNPVAPTVYTPLEDTVVFLNGTILPNKVYRFTPLPAEVKELSEAIDFTVSPNPAFDKMTISINDGADVETITIIDLSGKQLMQSNFQSDIDVSQYQQGYYIIEIETEDRTVARKKFLKQ
jgi:hypothetical protein